MKAAIIGHSGAGKSTLAKRLGTLYEAPVLYLDKINFTENWQERDQTQALQLVNDFMKNNSWIIEGNYQAFEQKRRMEQADAIIYLDFPRWLCLYRACAQYLKHRNQTREDMGDGCIEKFDREFLRWILFEGRTAKRIQHFHDLRTQYPEKFITLKNPKQVQSYLNSLKN